MKYSNNYCFYAIAGFAVFLLQQSSAFTTNHHPFVASVRSSSSSLNAMHSRASHRSGKDRSKRQYRVSQLVQTELGKIIHSGIIKGDVEFLDDELRRRISVVSVDVSPDLKQARVSTSIRASKVDESNAAVDKRRAYSWLVQNTKPIRHTLAQKMSHMKSSPALTFVQVDVAAAVDVMYLIDKVSKGYSREQVGEFGGDDDSLPRGFLEGMDFDEEDDEDDWDEEDNDFFDKSD